MGITGALSRSFLYGLNNTKVIGLDRFLETLDKRKDVEGRERGLITGEQTFSISVPRQMLTDLLNSIKPHQRVRSDAAMTLLGCDMLILDLQNG